MLVQKIRNRFRQKANVYWGFQMFYKYEKVNF
jgi:hypothetical protein